MTRKIHDVKIKDYLRMNISVFAIYATISLQCNAGGLIICQKMERGKSAYNVTTVTYKVQH